MGTGKYCKDTSILDKLQQFSTSTSSLTDPKDVFLRLPPRKMNIPPPSTRFFFFSFCCQRRQSCTKQAQPADCVSNKCQDSFPLRPPSLPLPPTSLQAHDNCRGRGEEGDDGRKARPAHAQKKAARGFGPKRNHINRRPQLSYRQA